MKVGVIGSRNYMVSGRAHSWEVHGFVISPETLSFYSLCHSAFATPARYLQEIWSRLNVLSDAHHGQPTFIFNPLFDGGVLAMMQVFALLRDQCGDGGGLVFADRDGRPIGYLLPASLTPPDSRLLTLLSTVDANLDAALLRHLFRAELRCIAVPNVDLSRSSNNGFLYKENQVIFKKLAERALKTLTSGHADRDSIPFTAFMPQHAGDVLFFSLAFTGWRNHFTRIAVSQAYMDIVRDNASSIEIVLLRAPLTNRDQAFREGRVTPESAYFDAVETELPDDSFYYYCRPSRDYNVSIHHLIDHFAFAIGAHVCTNADLIAHYRRYICATVQRRGTVPPRVLLHFDGGWPLKVYPRNYQTTLIQLLFEAGYEVTVLSDNFDANAKCRVLRFKNYSQLKELIADHDVLVGMDSFPAHFAAHIYGLPTICLFASTRPDNSNAPGALNYLALERGLKCRPCYGIARCPRYGSDFCRNFVLPEAAANAVGDILKNVNQGGQTYATKLSELPKAFQDCIPTPNAHRENERYISLRFIKLKVALLGLFVPRITYMALLYKEFQSSVRTNGWAYAWFRALRFIRRMILR